MRSLRSRWALGAFVAALLSCAGKAPPDLPVVRKLELEGVKQVNGGDLRGKILTSETFWLTGWLPVWFPFADRKYFELNTWRADLRRIERYYQAHGFYQARVVSDDVDDTDPKNLRLKATVDEGEPTRVVEVTLQGLDELPEELRKKVLEKLPVKTGDVFEEGSWNALKSAVPQRLREVGFAEARAEGEARVDLEQRTARLIVTVTPGDRYRFGPVQVVTPPDPEVPPERVADRARPAVKPERWFSESALADAQSRVSRMGVFGAVRVTPGTPDKERGLVPVVVEVNEAPFKTIRAGAGLGIDPIRQEARAIAEYQDRNFLGGLRKLNVTARAGYALILFGRTPNGELSRGPFYSVTGSFTQPRFLHRELRLNALLESSSNIEQAYQYLGGRARIGVSWHPHPDLVFRPSYNFEAYRLWGQSTLIGSGGSVAAPSLTFGCANTPCNTFLSYLEQTVEWDRRNNPIEPTSGYYVSLSFQEGGGPLGGSFTYLRIQPDLRYYQPLGERVVLAGRVRAGTLIPLKNETSPIVARFFAGGANSMRGFGTNRLSPLQAVPAPFGQSNPSTLAAPFGTLPGYTYGEVPGLTVPIGGNGMFEASLELRWEIVKNLILAVYADGGLVTQESFGAWFSKTTPVRSPYFSNMQYALGFGLRYRTPVGPIRVDIAHRLNAGPGLPVLQAGGPPIYYPTQGTCFGILDRGQRIAGAPEGPCAFHISIGEAF